MSEVRSQERKATSYPLQERKRTLCGKIQYQRRGKKSNTPGTKRTLNLDAINMVWESWIVCISKVLDCKPWKTTSMNMFPQHSGAESLIAVTAVVAGGLCWKVFRPWWLSSTTGKWARQGSCYSFALCYRSCEDTAIKPPSDSGAWPWASQPRAIYFTFFINHQICTVL